jgi:hypothetical protein
MTRINLSRSLRLVLPLTALLLSAGCFVINPTPTPESALAGTWKLTTAQSTELTQTFLTFDAAGLLIRVTYKIGTNTTIANDNVTAISKVDGDNVTIVSTFGGNTVTFNGTFNADKTVIEGTQGTEIKINGVTISIDNGAVTLTKQSA